MVLVAVHVPCLLDELCGNESFDVADLKEARDRLNHTVSQYRTATGNTAVAFHPSESHALCLVGAHSMMP